MSFSRDRWLFIWLFKLSGLALLLAACTGPSSLPTPGSGLDTGIAVAPEFQEFFYQNGGVQLFGSPISSAYIDTDTGRLMQYFQRLRLERDPQTSSVAVSPLGVFFKPDEADQLLAAVSENGPERTFPGTNLVVRDAFLTYYEENGDQLIFGTPITPQLDEGGKLVQYFENAELIWNPNAPTDLRVELAPLADAYYWQYGAPESDSFNISGSATTLEADVRAAVKEPILYAGEEQVLYVTVVTSGSLQRVEGAAVRATIRYGGLSTDMIFANPTDAFGQTQSVLEMPGLEPGDTVMVEVEVISAGGAALGETMLSFRAWW